MSQIFMCHNNIKTSQENIDRSRACLTEVMRNLTQSDKMETCVNMLQEARKQHLVLTWPSKKRAHKRSPLTEYKNLINSIFEEFSKGSQVLDRLGGVQALAKLGKYVDVADFSKLVAGVGAESDLAVGKEHFLQITFKLLAKEVKSKSQSRLTSLSKPKNKTGELTVEDYLNQVAEEKQAEARVKLLEKFQKQGSSKSFMSRRGSFSSNAMKVKKKSSLNRNNSIVTSCPIQYEFKRLDVNGDGVLSYDELFEGLKHRMEQDDLAELFDYMDANGDGMVTMEEFCEAKSKIDQNKPKLIF
uniref:EF-hand domain-containing protein n=1 Tax=Guillardia theta TaxID=55529 RepID=A0A7S4KW62_GUITH